MIDKSRLRQVMLDQSEYFYAERPGLIKRDMSLDVYIKSKQIVIISGVRRCGKSTLMRLIKDNVDTQKSNVLYLNLDDDRLAGFGVDDFQSAYELFLELNNPKGKIYFYLDEIQNVKGWEKFVNRMYENGVKIFITGSNSSLLGSEVSSSITGRNMVIFLFPFSFAEYLSFKRVEYAVDVSTKKKSEMLSLFNQYLNLGGFPLVVEENNPMLLDYYYQDILNKDIIIRFGIDKIKELKVISNYLISNCSKLYSYQSLQNISGLKSLSTIKNFIEYLETPFLLFNLPKFDYSLKKQIYNPKKSYCIDNGFVNKMGFRGSEDFGRLLENVVFLGLKRRGFELFYFKGDLECDFVVKSASKVVNAIQVCYELNEDNKKREINGLIEAMDMLNLKSGLILTHDKEDDLFVSGKKIKVKPVWKWLLQKQK